MHGPEWYKASFNLYVVPNYMYFYLGKNMLFLVEDWKFF